MMARSSKAPSIGRIQKRKTNFSKSSLFGLQRAAGPYRWANSVDAGRITMTMTCRGSKSLIEND
jgi:hypothetical protein